MIKLCLLVALRVHNFLEHPERSAETVDPLVSWSTVPPPPPVDTVSVSSIARNLSEFEVLDKNHDGCVTRAEFDAVDTDGDGAISKAEMTAARMWLAVDLKRQSDEQFVKEQALVDSPEEGLMEDEDFDSERIPSVRVSAIDRDLSAVSDDKVFEDDDTNATDGVHATPTQALYNCGLELSYVLYGDWATSLLSLMLHFADKCLNENKNELIPVSSLTEWLLEKALDTRHRRAVVLSHVFRTRLAVRFRTGKACGSSLFSCPLFASAPRAKRAYCCVPAPCTRASGNPSQFHARLCLCGRLICD
jgi:hypothetical protein